jgi:hypothetical protein
MTLASHAAFTPAGRPIGAPMPVAPVVAIVIALRGELTHSVGLEEGDPAVFVAKTVIARVLAGPAPQALFALTDKLPEVAAAE